MIDTTAVNSLHDAAPLNDVNQLRVFTRSSAYWQWDRDGHWDRLVDGPGPAYREEPFLRKEFPEAAGLSG